MGLKHMSDFFSRRGFISASAATALIHIPRIASAAPVIALPSDAARRDPSTILAVRTPSQVVAMTFDDGPHPTLTPRLLDILKARNLKATFYVIGRRVAQWPDIVRRTVDEGHEIGNHTWSHPVLSKMSDEAVIREIDRTTDIIYKVTGRPPVTFRPPYGAFTLKQRKMLHTRRKLPSILWSVDPQDWRRPGAAAVSHRILSGAHKGAIILSHDIQSGTISAMPGTFDGLTSRGLNFATVSQIMGWPTWQNRNFKRVVEG